MSFLYEGGQRKWMGLFCLWDERMGMALGSAGINSGYSYFSLLLFLLSHSAYRVILVDCTSIVLLFVGGLLYISFVIPTFGVMGVVLVLYGPVWIFCCLAGRWRWRPRTLSFVMPYG